MDKTISREHWLEFCKEFSKRNYQRATRLQTLDSSGSRLEEAGWPLEGIDLDTKDDASPCLEIMLGDDGNGGRHFCHTVQHVHRIVSKVGANGQDEVLEIEALDDVRTLIHLHNLPVLTT